MFKLYVYVLEDLGVFTEIHTSQTDQLYMYKNFNCKIGCNISGL